MLHLSRRLLAGLFVVAGLATAQAADYPSRNITIVVGFGAGGPTDLPARFIAQKLGPLLHTDVVVENRAAASGMLATRYVLSRPADGYTLLFCTHFESINSVLFKDAPYKISDIAPVTQVSSYYYGFAISNSLPVNTFQEFVAYAKAHPRELNQAASASQEIMANQFEKATGAQMIRVPFNSTPQIQVEMMAGRIHFDANPISSLIPLYKNKQLKLIAVSGPSRMAEAPDVPTLDELGIKGIYAQGWLGICARAGTPSSIIDTLNANIRTIVATPEYRQLLEAGGSEPVSSTPEEFGKLITSTVDQIAPTIKEFNMQKTTADN